MACVGSCRVCGGQTLNTNIHQKCEIAALNDFLFRIKKQVSVHPDNLLTSELIKEILEGHFRSMEEHQESERKERELADQKQIWSLARDAVVQKAKDEFEEKNPDPKPNLY